MTKITFLGAGSVVFTRELLGAIYAYPELRHASIALYDIDPRRLDAAERTARLLSNAAQGTGEILATTNLGQALDGADYVINTVAVGGLEATRKDNEIPAKYGIHQVIGDTLGIGGISRAVRTIPVAVGFAHEMEKRCPNALMLNYSNPMSMVTWGVYAASKIKVVGHSQTPPRNHLCPARRRCPQRPQSHLANRQRCHTARCLERLPRIGPTLVLPRTARLRSLAANFYAQSLYQHQRAC
ncbi:MAG: hypothetical protein Fur0016_24190 [Anaerolineales bacterium]